MQKGLDQRWSIARFSGFQIVEMRLDTMEGPEPREFTQYSLSEVSTAPDGRAIVASYDATIDSVRKQMEICPTELRKDYLACFKKLPPHPKGIIILDTNGRDVWRWEGRILGVMALSANLEKIAFQSRRGLSFVLKATMEIRTLDPGADKEDSLTWSPDGTEILHVKNGEIRICDTRVRRSRPLARGAEPRWSPNGEWISYRSPENSGIVVRPSGEGQRTIISGKKLAGPLRWSPDSQYLLYSEHDSRNWENRILQPLTAQLVVYRLRDGAELSIIRAVPEGVGEAFEWIVRR